MTDSAVPTRFSATTQPRACRRFVAARMRWTIASRISPTKASTRIGSPTSGTGPSVYDRGDSLDRRRRFDPPAQAAFLTAVVLHGADAHAGAYVARVTGGAWHDANQGIARRRRAVAPRRNHVAHGLD